MCHSLISSVLVRLLYVRGREGSSPFLSEDVNNVGISVLLLLKKCET